MVVGTNFGQRHHPGWMANLLAHPDASIEVGPEQLSVTGELVDQATWERLWPRFVAVYPGYANYLTAAPPGSRACSGCARARRTQQPSV